MRNLYVGRPVMNNSSQLRQNINEIFDSLWLSNDGPYLRRFEEAVREMLGVRNFIAVCNGTVALEIALRALGVQGEVIVPSWTFIATPHSAVLAGCKPVFADVREDHTVSPWAAGSLITERTGAILAVRLWGRQCDTAALRDLANEHSIPLIYDSAHAFGIPGIGSSGDCEIFSFHATKFFNTLEGGGIATNDDGLARKCRLAGRFGFQGEDDVVAIGTNGKMQEVSAAVGLANLEIVQDTIATNHRNYEQYRRLLGSRVLDLGTPSNYQYVVIGLPKRDRAYRALLEQGVHARRYFYPACHKTEPYVAMYPDLSLPMTEWLAERTLVLPTGPQMQDGDIARVCGTILDTER